jgi:hypothetical protein
MILQWFRRRQEAHRLAQAEAYGAEAYRKAWERERDVDPERRDNPCRPADLPRVEEPRSRGLFCGHCVL